METEILHATGKWDFQKTATLHPHNSGGVVSISEGSRGKAASPRHARTDANETQNRIGGEAASLAIPHKHQKEFASAGYAPLTLAGPEEPPFVSYGLTRQHGNLSFTRIFQAGHMVPSYQPEASLRIFERALFNRDIATGAVDLTATGGWAAGAAEVFRTEGPGDTWWMRSEVLPAPERRCYILQMMTCTGEEVEALRNGTAVVKDFMVVDIKSQGAGGHVVVEGEGSGGDGLLQGVGSQVVVGAPDEL